MLIDSSATPRSRPLRRARVPECALPRVIACRPSVIARITPTTLRRRDTSRLDNVESLLALLHTICIMSLLKPMKVEDAWFCQLSNIELLVQSVEAWTCVRDPPRGT